MGKPIAAWTYAGDVPPGLIRPTLAVEREADKTVKLRVRGKSGVYSVLHLSAEEWIFVVRDAVKELTDA